MSEVSIYNQVVFDLHPRVKDILADLNTRGQIDHDEHGHPFLISCDRVGPNTQCVFMRNGQKANFIVNTRRSADPEFSFQEDGWARPEKETTPVAVGDRRPERQRRAVESVYHDLVEAILK